MYTERSVPTEVPCGPFCLISPLSLFESNSRDGPLVGGDLSSDSRTAVASLSGLFCRDVLKKKKKKTPSAAKLRRTEICFERVAQEVLHRLREARREGESEVISRQTA